MTKISYYFISMMIAIIVLLITTYYHIHPLVNYGLLFFIVINFLCAHYLLLDYYHTHKKTLALISLIIGSVTILYLMLTFIFTFHQYFI